MQQLSIKYFYPLTEQIELDLDFTPCEKYDEWKRKDSLYVGNRLNCWDTVPLTFTGSNIAASLCIDVDQTPITIMSKEKPNFVKRYVYKALGMKWESK